MKHRDSFIPISFSHACSSFQKCGINDVQPGTSNASLGSTLKPTNPSTTKNNLANTYANPHAPINPPKTTYSAHLPLKYLNRSQYIRAHLHRKQIKQSTTQSAPDDVM
jgi:hypothetical protein